jgi:murein DD-endopeptidase MepM/ murein hydrolase activator NlpD
LPARSHQARSNHVWITRSAIAAIATLLLFTASVGTAAPVHGANWSRQIAATRQSQLYYESAMVSADRQNRVLKKESKKTRRKIGKAKRKLARVKARRAELRDRVAGTRSLLSVASASLEEQQALERARVLMTLMTLELQPIPYAALSQPTATTPTTAADLGFGGNIAPPLSRHQTTPDDVKVLRQSLKKQARSLRKVQRKVRRATRTKRARVNHLRAVKRQRRATLARRGGAEAALKSRILSMSRLAAHRAAKKTKARPGRNTRFVWPARGRISQGYGCTGSRFSPSRGSCGGFHDGIDVAAGQGSTIRAAGVGVISYVGRNPWDRGKRAFMVVVAHPGGYETLYAHVLPIRRVKVGQLVHKGKPIAFMGSTGHSTGTHLHFELRRGRTTLNPLAFL